MNITVAYLFQNIEKPWMIEMYYERAEISEMNDRTDFKFIGTVNYDTERKIIVD